MGFVYLYLSSIGFISPPDEASTFPFSTPSRRSLSKETSPNPSNGPEDLCLKPQEKDRTQGVSFIFFFIWFGHLSEMLELSFWNMANWKMGSPHGEFKCASICVFFCVDIIEFWCPSKSQLIPTASFSPLQKNVFWCIPSIQVQSVFLAWFLRLPHRDRNRRKNPSNPGKNIWKVLNSCDLALEEMRA